MQHHLASAIRQRVCAAVLSIMAMGLIGCGDSSIAVPANGNGGSAPVPEIALAKSCSSVEGATLRPKSSAVPAACVAKSWLAGSTELCEGRHVYRDYVYDDFGADALLPANHAGDATYPTGQANTADLVNLHLWTENGRLRIRGELNALFDSATTVLALAIDTDDNPATGGGTWCDLGITSAGWEVLQAFRQGDVDSNVIEGSIPMPAGSRWRVRAATAQADGTVMNVAYRGTDEISGCDTSSTSKGCYFEDKQAAALMAGDVSDFSVTVAVSDLVGKVSRPAAAVTPGFHSRVYTSAHTLPPGEGLGHVAGRGNGALAPVAAQFFDFLGKYQPYGFYMPSTARPPYPLQMLFHGSGQTHTDVTFRPGLQRDVGEALGRLIANPLARGPDGYGSDISERDLLDVLDDMEASYPIDADRVFVSGYSQGGYIAYRMAEMYPQRFAGFISWVGFTGDVSNGIADGVPSTLTAGAVGNVRKFVGNLRHVPGAMVYAGADELVHSTSARAMQQEFAARDNLYRWFLHPVAEHDTFQRLDEWAKEAAYLRDLKRVVNPPRVTYRHDPTLGSPTYGIKHDRAYWVSGIVNRQVGADHLAEVFGDLDLTNHACGGELPVTATANNAGPSPLPWISEERNATGATTPLPAQNLLEGQLVNIASLMINAAETCNAGKPLRYVLTTDGPAEIRLSDGRVIRLPAAGEHRGQI